MSLTDLWWWADSGPPAPPNQTVALSGALAVARTSSPNVTVEGVVAPRLRAVLVHVDSGGFHDVAELSGAMARQWQDVLNDAGSASMVLGNEDPQAAQIKVGDVIRFEDDGWATFSWVVTEIERVDVARGEAVDQVTTVSGAGLLHLLANVLVYPWGGPEVEPHSDDRMFTWASPDAYDWFWPGAKELVRYGDVGTTRLPDGRHIGWSTTDGVPIPPPMTDPDDVLGWPDVGAQWISAQGTSVDNSPPGVIYFHRRIDVPDDVAYLDMYLVADNRGYLWFDGRYVGYNDWAADDTLPMVVSEPVTPGEHLIAVEIENPAYDLSDPLYNHNPAGVLFTCYPSDGETITGGPLMHSDMWWTYVAYPPNPPGMTAGMVMWRCILEAQFRGALPGLRIAFDAIADSDGNPWPMPIGGISTKVGVDYLTFFREICETYADMWIEPGTFTLYAWVKGMRGENKPHVRLYPVTDPNDPWSGNVAGLTYTKVE